MKSNFTREFFTGNRKRLRELFTGKAPIVVSANGLLQKSSDSSYQFVQDANFWYLCGIDEPDIILVLDKDKEYLIVPKRSESREAFDGAIDYDELIEKSGVELIYDYNKGWEQLESRIKKVKHIATVAVPPAYVEHFGMYTNPARASMIDRIKNTNSEIELLDISPHLSRLRMIKQPQEISAIEEAIAITIKSIRAATKPAKLSKYEHEYEIEAEISLGFRKNGARGHAFEPIVANGGNACVIHYSENSDQLSSKDLVLIDVGAEYDHYAADITRVVSLSTPTKRQQAVFDAVLDTQEYALSLLGPRVILKEYEQQVEQYMGEKLRELGLIKTIDHDSVRKYYPYYSSHFLGLNVHDNGLYDRPLESGVVITVEPGIHIPEEGIGVRLEDDVLITKNGIKNLSQKLPKRLC